MASKTAPPDIDMGVGPSEPTVETFIFVANLHCAR